MNKKYWLLGLLVLLIGWYIWHRHDRKVNQQASSTVLAPGVVEKVVVNPQKHTIEVITPESDHTLSLPDRPSSIEVHKDNSVVVTSLQFGTEHHFFAGFLGADSLRIVAGEDLFYFKKFDAGLGVADRVGNYGPIAIAKISYNIYGGLQIGVYYGSNALLGGALTVRFF